MLPDPKPEKKGLFRNIKDEPVAEVEDPINLLFKSSNQEQKNVKEEIVTE